MHILIKILAFLALIAGSGLDDAAGWPVEPAQHRPLVGNLAALEQQRIGPNQE